MKQLQECYLMQQKRVHELRQKSLDFTDRWLDEHGQEVESPYYIEDNGTFEMWSEAVTSYERAIGLYREEGRLDDIEQKLIDIGLEKVRNSLPYGTFETIQRGRNNFKIRKKLVDLMVKGAAV